MISVTEAQTKLLKAVIPIQDKIRVKVAEASGFVLAESVFSPLHLPPFNQSNVDGYSLSNLASESWEVVAEIKAGDAPELVLQAGQAVRIFTGAMLPQGTDAIVMQEHTERQGNKLRLNIEPKPGEHIRKQASQLKKGDLALEKGSKLNPAALGFLQMLGITEISVYRKPKIALIITGNELQTPGSDLQTGMVYESNAVMLCAALENLTLQADKIYYVKDDKQHLSEAVKQSLAEVDVLLLSGGISVGDYDFVYEVLQEVQAETLFYKVAQKPGKPLYAGKLDEKMIFALPGNPSSALNCFYEYVYPVLNALSGKEKLHLKHEIRKITQDYSKKTGLAHFLKASCTAEEVTVLEAQESFMMKSFAKANCFIFLREDITQVKAGDEVEIHLLPE